MLNSIVVALYLAGKVKADLKHDACTLTSDVDLNLGGPMVNASAVIGHKGWLAGYQMAFDSSKSKLTKNNFGIGYATKDFVLHTNVNDGQVFGGSVYQRVNNELETAVNLGWTSSNNATNFGIGCKYALDRDSNIRAKINNSSQVGLGYQQKLRPGNHKHLLHPHAQLKLKYTFRCHSHLVDDYRR